VPVVKDQLNWTPAHRVERWCNAVAAELLVPLQSLREVLPEENPLSAVAILARQFKVSSLVIVRLYSMPGTFRGTFFRQPTIGNSNSCVNARNPAEATFT